MRLLPNWIEQIIERIEGLGAEQEWGGADVHGWTLLDGATLPPQLWCPYLDPCTQQ